MWKYFKCIESELNCKIVLACGQSFRWTQDPVTNVWVSVLNNRVWFIEQNGGKIYFKTHPGLKDEKEFPAYILKSGSCLNNMDEEAFLRDYFQLDIDIPKLYKKWSDADSKFSKLQKTFCGIRMLRQDPVENLFSFICSQNNNISRISQLVNKLCINYGNLIAECDGVSHYSFPSISSLAQPDVEEKLRKLGFGYRAKFLHQTAKYIVDKGGDQWLYSLREKSYEDAHRELMLLPGVGAKVADCVCLMSLDKTEAIPIDTHMWQVALRDYLPHLQKQKTVTDKAYKEIGNYFRNMYGEYAGWAHTVLFSADLKKFETLKKSTSKSKPSVKRKLKATESKSKKDKKKKPCLEK